MLRILTRLFMALAALLAMRLIFAAARRMNRQEPSPSLGEKPEGKVAGRGTRLRIDRKTAQDVPYVEVEAESVRRG